MANDGEMTRDPYNGLQPGDRVKHAKFGDGQIIARSGSGEDTKILVRFAEGGEKRLMAKLAKLKKAEIETAPAPPAPPVAPAEPAS